MGARIVTRETADGERRMTASSSLPALPLHVDVGALVMGVASRPRNVDKTAAFVQADGRRQLAVRLQEQQLHAAGLEGVEGPLDQAARDAQALAFWRDGHLRQLDAGVAGADQRASANDFAVQAGEENLPAIVEDRA